MDLSTHLGSWRWPGLVVASVLLAAPVARASAASDVEDGEAAEKNGDVAKAIEKYQDALKDEPGNEGAALDLSVVYRRAEQFDKAIAVLNQVLQINPTSVRIANNLGVVYRLNKQYDEADVVLRTALSRAPGNIDTYKNMAVLLYDQGKLQLAEQFALEAKKINDKDSGVWNNLGLIYYKKDGADKPTRALAAFKRATELNSKDETAWLNVGAISMRYRDYVNAEKAFANAVQLDGESYQNHLWHAYALDGSKKFDDAIGEYDAALARKSDLNEVYFAKGLILQTMQKWAPALEQCQKYLDTKPEDPAKLERTNTCVKTAQYMRDLANKPPAPSIAAPPKDEKKPEEKKPEEAKPEEKKPEEAAPQDKAADTKASDDKAADDKKDGAKADAPPKDDAKPDEAKDDKSGDSDKTDDSGKTVAAGTHE